MRKNVLVTCVVLAVVAMLAGCGSKSEQAMETSSDSLLAANPSEPAPGDITPQTPYEQPQTPAVSAPPVSSPKPSTPRPSTPKPSAPVNRGVTVPEGTPIKVAVDAQISSETAQPGDTWTGVVKEPVVIGTDAPIPAGSVVHGVITGSLAAERGNRATLVMAVKSITVGSQEYTVPAGTDSIIAGSPRARNLGAIAGSAAAGALIGKAVGGNKGALIGGILGGGAATGVVAKSKGYQVVLKPGTELTFTVSRSVVMK
ncbi:MAG TPA: hypothetical protein VJY35_08550 [Candidatus Eisenbacteria bacterium]|nr:hypothetical protein [Candidatus Eisenbacteria bacterium]